MLKRISIRLRLTILSVLLLTICCIGLTVVLNFSANLMIDTVEATPITPAHELAPEETAGEPEKTAMLTIEPPEAFQDARNRFLYQSILAVVLIVAAGGGLTHYLSGKALRPLRELSAQMQNRTVHNLAESLPVPQSRDEVAALTKSFNEMSGKLGEAFAMQKRFSQSAAHELRTPLTVLKTKVDVFRKKKERSPEEYEKLLEVITTHTNRMTDLVQDLLGLSNMDALECGDAVALKAMLSSVSAELTELAAKKGVEIIVSGVETTVRGNRSLLHRAFYNLMENSVKYNRENGRVAVAVDSDGSGAVVTVSDTGIGVPADMRELIFEPFFRVDKSRSRQIGGAGLGLSMVKTVVEKHGGSVCVSENPAGGTVFTVEI